MTYQEIYDRLTKVESALTALNSGGYATQGINVPQATQQLTALKESLEEQLRLLQEQEAGTVETDDEREAENLAKKGVNVKLTKEEEGDRVQFDTNETRAIGKEVAKALASALRELGDEVSSMKLTNLSDGTFNLECTYKGAGGAEYSFYISDDTLYLTDNSYDREIAEVGVKPSGEAIVNKDVVKDALLTTFKSMSEGMSDEEFADAQEKERLDKHPEKKTIEKIQAMMAKEKTLKEDWGSSDQSAMNQSIHRDLGNPTEFPGLSKVMDAAEDAVDFYWDDWEEYETDREGLIMHAARMYARSMFPDFMAMAAKMVEPVDEAMDFNDPVLVKLRAAAEKVKGEKNKQAALPLELSPAKQLMLGKLKRKRAEVLRDMEQEAEPEGGPIADKYGDMLNKIDDAIAKLQGQKVYEGYKVGDKVSYLGHPGEITAVEDQYGKIFVSVAYDKGQGRTKARGILATSDSIKPVTNEDMDLGHQDNEPHMLKADLYRIAKYATDLYKVMSDLEGQGEVDLPHWWQAKIINAKDALVGAKHYLDFELKEPAIDAVANIEPTQEEVTEAQYTDYSNSELAAYCKNNPEDKAAADELHKRSQNLKDLSRTDVNEAPEGMYYITVSVRDARKALDILDDMYRKQFVIDGSNRYYFSNPEIAYDAFMDFGAHGIEIEDTNVDDDMLQEASAASIQKKHSALVNKMKELAKEYTKAEGDKKEKIKDQLKSMTAEKKQLEKDLDKAVAGTGRDQELSNVDESKKKITREALRRIVESAYIEVLREAEEEEEAPAEEPAEEPEAPAEQGAVLATGTEEILNKFPTLKRNIINFFTEDYDTFIKQIDWIAPKPTTFKVVLENGQFFILKWMGKFFEAQIMGKRYDTSKVDDYQQALDKLNELLKQAPLGGEEAAAAGAEPNTDFGSGGAAGDFPGEEGGGEDFEDTGAEDTGDEEVEFEEPAEEPEA